MRTKNIFCLSSTMIATVIGAGFATGQEIYSFFTQYGKWSFLGLLLVWLLFRFVFYIVPETCRYNKIDGFADFLVCIGLKKSDKWIQICVVLFSFCGLCAMASATGALVRETLQIPYMYGAIGLLMICGVVLCFDIRAVAGLNCILAPAICIGLVYYSMRGMLFRSVTTVSMSHYYTSGAQIAMSSLIYVSYNFLSAVVVLCAMRRYCDNKKTVRFGAEIGAGVLVFLALFVWCALFVYQHKIALGELPMLQIASRGGAVHTFIYSVLLLLSIFTTAMSCGFAVVDYLKSYFRCSSVYAVVLCVLAACPVCILGFSGIVRVIYAFFGYLGLPFLAILFTAQIKFRRKSKKKLKNIENA